MRTITYTEARQNLASVLNEVASTCKPVAIKRRDHPDVALLPSEELSSLMETVHLLRSPANAKRLHAALKRAVTGKGRRMTVGDASVSS